MHYGPYIYHFGGYASALITIVPHHTGQLNFTSESDPVRHGQRQKLSYTFLSMHSMRYSPSIFLGFEVLTMSPDGNTIYALLQSTTIQDGGDEKINACDTRLVAYDVFQARTTRPPLIGE